MNLFKSIFTPIRDFVSNLFGGSEDDRRNDDIYTVDEDFDDIVGGIDGAEYDYDDDITDIEEDAGVEAEDEQIAGEGIEGDAVGDYVLDEPEFVNPYDIDAQEADMLREFEPELEQEPEPEPEPQVPENTGDIDEWLDNVDKQFNIYDEQNEDLLDEILGTLSESEPEEGEGFIQHGTFDSLDDLGEFLKDQYTWEWHITQRLKAGREGYDDDDYEYTAWIKYDSP